MASKKSLLKKQPISKSFCLLPWFGHEFRADGSESFCCISNFVFSEVAKSKSQAKLASIRKSLLAGKNPKACEACWSLERSGNISRRQKLNMLLRAQKYSDASDLKTKRKVIVLDIKVGNRCNQKCLICDPKSSTLWFKEYSAVYGAELGIKQNNLLLHKQKLSKLIVTARELHIAGGEPFLDLRGLRELLSIAVESGASKAQTLIITSNGSIFPDDLVSDIFPHFKKVQILLSADGVGAQFEYQRYPGKWELFLQNYHKLKATPFFGGICITLSALNAFDLVTYLKFWESQGEKNIFLNHLNEPECLAVKHLPRKIRTAIARKWILEDFRSVIYQRLVSDSLSYLEKSKDAKQERIADLFSFILRHDRFRKLEFREYFPDYAFLLDKYNSSLAEDV